MSGARKILSVAVLALVAALIALGCGGSDGGGTESSESQAKEQAGPLTKAVFIKRADAICRRADDVSYNKAKAYRDKHQKELNELSAVGEEEKMIRLFIFPAVEEELKAIVVLGAPQGEAKKVDKLIAAFEAGLKKARKNPYAIEGLVPTQNPFHKAANAAYAYGFVDCAEIT